jgi:hypothetical protein
MNNLFQKTSSHWVKYSEYELREKDGILYLKPAPKAKPVVYDPLKESDNMVLDTLNVGMLQMNRAGADKVKAAVMDFVSKYGLLGFMTALPTTPEFVNYEAVYLPTIILLKRKCCLQRNICLFSFRSKNWISPRMERNRFGILIMTER